MNNGVNIIGREKEIAEIEKYVRSERPCRRCGQYL